MWRICRKTIFSRWHVNRRNPVDNKNQAHPCPKLLVLCPVNENKKYSHHHNHHEQKQHADKQDKRCWDDAQFQFHFRSNLLQMARWVVTAAALCVNVHLQHFKTILDHDRPNTSSLLSRNVLAMQKKSISSKENSGSKTSLVTLVHQSESSAEKDKVSNNADILGDIQNLTDQYIASVQNSAGVLSLNKNDKKAFRCFQSAAHHGSSQAFYNLGLCYEFGKGTRINLQRAAFCYRKAALRGHGLASFNLAVYFMKGLGGLPIDTETAKLLLVEAANKGVPEAQIYLGIESLEKEKWSEAVAIFNNLSKENVPDAQYYLGLCYENGWGVRKDLRVATELFSKSATQGNQKAIPKLEKYSDVKTNDKGPMIKAPALKKSKRNSLHVSASFPELAASVKIPYQLSAKSLVPSYLDLMNPFFVIKSDFSKPKCSFFIEDDQVTKDCSTSFMSSLSVPQILPVET